MADDREIPLAGGNVNTGVVRVGDTVRRGVGPHSENVHRLLRHLERVGLAQAPRFLGLDEAGREVLSFIPGSSEFPPGLWLDEAPLVEATRMLRAYHDATSGLVAGPGGWAYEWPDRTQHEVICHNDFAPYNMIFDGGLPVAVIDFDLAGPGPRLRDLAYLAYWLVPLAFANPDMRRFAEADLAAGSVRLRLLARTYGTDDLAGLLDMVGHALAHMSSEAAARAMIGDKAAERLRDGGHFANWATEAGVFEAQVARLRANLD